MNGFEILIVDGTKALASYCRPIKNIAEFNEKREKSLVHPARNVMNPKKHLISGHYVNPLPSSYN